jgi:hypothetical protein
LIVARRFRFSASVTSGTITPSQPKWTRVFARTDADDFDGEADDDAFETVADDGDAFDFEAEAFDAKAVAVEGFTGGAFADMAVSVKAFTAEVEAFAGGAFADMAVAVGALAIEAFAAEAAVGSVTTQSVADQPGVKAPDFWATNTCRPSCSTTCRNVSRLNSNCAARFKFSAAAAKLELPALSRHTNSRTPGLIVVSALSSQPSIGTSAPLGGCHRIRFSRTRPLTVSTVNACRPL